jgi:hypothetical protein
MTSLVSIQSEANNNKTRPDVSERTMLNSAITLKELKADLHEDWRTAVKNNMDVFQRKFSVLQKQLERDLPDFIHEESDRVIRKLRAGPHDRIYDDVSLFINLLVAYSSLINTVANLLRSFFEGSGVKW